MNTAKNTVSVDQAEAAYSRIMSRQMTMAFANCLMKNKAHTPTTSMIHRSLLGAMRAGVR